MTSLPAESQALVQNDHSSVQDSHSNVLSIGEELHGPGFRFVRSFLLVILVLVGCLLALAGVLSWYFSMDMTVESKGVIEPRHRYRVKAKIAGIIQQMHVRQGQQVEKGQPLVTLDDTDWQLQLQQAEKDLEVNRSQQRAIEQQMEQERNIRQAEVAHAQRQVERMRIQLEQVVVEQTIYSAGLLPTSVVRQPLDQLLPVRLGNAWLRDAEAELERTQQRLQAVEGRTAELQTLEKQREKIEQERQRLENRLAKNIIRAPAAGTVMTGQLDQRVGDRLQEGEAVLEMAQTDEWQAQIMVKEIDLPKIDIGQPARLYVNAFPHTEYKVFEGTVEEVSDAPVVENAVGGAVYPIKVSIPDPQVWDGEQVYSLAYGMNAEAKVVVERGRIVELLWKKLLQAAEPVVRHDLHRQEPAGMASTQAEINL